MLRRRSLATLTVLGLVLAACTSASPSTSPNTEPSASTAASVAESLAPFAATSYPAAGPADCGAPADTAHAAYTGEFSQIKAIDELTVEFDLCYPDPVFLVKSALASNAIQDSDYLAKNMPNSLILTRPNGTGPYKFKEYIGGDHVTLERNDAYWGDKAKAAELIFQWNSEAAARLLALQAGTVDGIDNPGTNDFTTISGDPNLQLKNRPALNVMYVGMTNTFAPFNNIKVRQALAQGIDRQRIIDNFYPAGSTVADYFTPCEITFGCEGTKWYDFNKDAANALLDDALGAGKRFGTHIYYRDVVRGYLPDPNVVAIELQSQLKDNLGITATIEKQESAAFLDNSSAGVLNGLYLLGWGADYPDPTNFLDYHFNNAANLQFGTEDASITGPLNTGAQAVDDAARAAAYAEANDAVRTFVPMIPIAHGASATAWKADVVGAHSSPITNEALWTVDPAGRSPLVFMVNAYPLSMYCGDETDGETIRVCFQMMETLYTWKTATAEVTPGLAESCDPNADATVWTCHLRAGVKFHNGAHLDAGDVLNSFALQWDAENPLHIGRTGRFEYWGGLFGTFLNKPAS